MGNAKGKESINADVEDEPLLPQNKTWLQKLAVWLFLSITIIVYYIAVTFAQISGLQVNIYQLYTCRYIIQTVIVGCIAIYNKASLKIQHKDAKWFLLLIAIETFQSSPFYSAATFMPVGTLDAFFNAVFIITSAIYDIIKKEISWFRMFCCVVVVAGIILTTQPWKPSTDVQTVIPCEYWENTINGESYAGISTDNNISTHNSQNNDSSKELSDLNTDNQQRFATKHEELIGYFLLTIAALLYTIKNNFAKHLYKDYGVSTVVFWLCLANIFTCLLVSVIWKKIVDEAYFDFNLGTVCLLFTILYTLTIALGNTFCYYSIYYTTVSTVAISLVCTSLLLYLSQRTFLKMFYPGHANTLEILGILTAICGISVLPAIEVLMKQRQQDS